MQFPYHRRAWFLNHQFRREGVLQEMQTICCLEKGVEMILIHKGHKPPGPLEATSIPWELDMWLQTQLHIIGDKDLSAADVAVKVLELVMEKCGKRINAFRVFEEHLIDLEASGYSSTTFDEERPSLPETIEALKMARQLIPNDRSKRPYLEQAIRFLEELKERGA